MARQECDYYDPNAATEEALTVSWGIANNCKILRLGKLRILTISFNTNNANPTGGASKQLIQLAQKDYPSAGMTARGTIGSYSMNVSINTSGGVYVTSYSNAVAETLYAVLVYVVS